jgi:hypothetical protein
MLGLIAVLRMQHHCTWNNLLDHIDDYGFDFRPRGCLDSPASLSSAQPSPERVSA